MDLSIFLVFVSVKQIDLFDSFVENSNGKLKDLPKLDDLLGAD